MSIDFKIPPNTESITITFLDVCCPKEKWWVRILNFFGIHYFDNVMVEIGDSGGIESSGYAVDTNER